MGLPEINLTFLNNIVSVPFHIHPAIVHFAVSLPIVILLIEIFNLFPRRRMVDIITVGLFGMLLFVLIGVYISGVTDGKEAFELLDNKGQEALKSHKIFGTYIILFGFTLAALFKTLSLLTNKIYYKMLYIVILALFIAITLKQGKDGGELVNVYGVNVQKAKMLEDELFDLQMKYDDLNSSFSALKAKEANATDINKSQELNSTIKTIDANATKTLL
ncbi:MAG: hypothetical protein IE890_04090 [Arcobacter sp.]|nr:hypothetical protein [Campylobacterota bacterium]MBD3829649.1 hypothetical protein [Arcobacter sp.]